MRIPIVVLFAMFFVLPASVAVAQHTPPTGQRLPEHEFLKKFVGHWEVDSKAMGMSGGSVMKSSMLGHLWLVNESVHKMGQTQIKSLQMIGYAPAKKKYVGTWADSMLNYLWHYEGFVDESGKKLILSATGPSMLGDGKTKDYRDIYEFKDDDTMIATSMVKSDDGTWNQMSQGTCRRKAVAQPAASSTKPAASSAKPGSSTKTDGNR